MAEQTRIIKVISQVVGEKSIKDIANSLDRMNNSMKRGTETATSLRNMMAAVFGAQVFGFGIRELTNMSDTMTQLNSKLNIFVGGGKKASDTFEELKQLADDTRSPLTSVATIFTRLATSTERLGLSVRTQLDVTRILQQSFRVSGATAEEATASTIQFAQALSFGQLRGQELRSVLSQNSALATIFGKAIEGTGKDIYKFAEAGGFTTKFVLKTLLENMDQLEEKAKKLAPTFEQTLNRAMNKLTETVDNLNKKFKLNEGFAAFVDYIINNGKSLMEILVALGATLIPKLIVQITAMSTALLASPMTWWALGLSGATYGVIKFSGSLENALANVQLFTSYIEQLSIVLQNPVLTLANKIPFLGDDEEAKQIGYRIERLKKYRRELELFKQYSKFQGGESLSIADEMKMRFEKAASLDIKDPPKAIADQIKALNTQYMNGTITASKYAEAINRLDAKKLAEDFMEGRSSLEKFNEEKSKLRLTDLSRQLDLGAISIDEFNQAINRFKIEELSRKFYEGKITVRDYNAELMKLKIEGMNPDDLSTGFIKGLNSVIEGVGTTSDQIASLTKSVFSSMEDAIFQATKGSTRAFAEMTQAILDDITKIAIRMAIVKPLAEGLLGGLFGNNTASGVGSGGIGSSPNSTATSQFAMGGAFDRGVQKFATGGVVSSPTYFGLNSGKMGLMGEAGPEAIVPLKRASNGSLGVGAAPTVVNVHNYAKAEVQTRENVAADGTKTIDVIIISKVKEAIAGGAFDRTFQQNYGLSRRGV